MVIINSASLLSGLAAQQNYAASGLAGVRTNRDQIRSTVMPSGDTVQISSEAWALFRAQTADSAVPLPSSAANGSEPRTASENASGKAAETFGSPISVKEQISQLETDISGLEGEIAALEERAGTDELAAALLRSKQAQLQILLAKMTGLLAKAFQLE